MKLILTFNIRIKCLKFSSNRLQSLSQQVLGVMARYIVLSRKKRDSNIEVNIVKKDNHEPQTLKKKIIKLL